MEISKEKRGYDKIKELAKKFADFNKEMVVIYKIGTVYNFVSFQEYHKNPEGQLIEILSHL